MSRLKVAEAKQQLGVFFGRFFGQAKKLPQPARSRCDLVYWWNIKVMKKGLEKDFSCYLCYNIAIMWFTFAFLGYASLAVVAILDKFILSQEKLKPIVYVFYSTVFLAPLLLAFPFFKISPSTFEWLIISLGAISYVLSLGSMYLAFQKSEVSHSGPFIGALVPLFVLVLGQIFLGETIVNTQIFGIFLLSAGTLMISMQKNPSLSDWRSGLNWAIVSSFLFATFHTSAKYTYSAVGFAPGFIYMWGLAGIIGIILLLSKEVRLSVFPEKNIGFYLHKIFKKRSNTKRQVIIVAGNKLLSVVSVVLIQYAVSIGSVTKVNALSGAQYGLLVLIVAGMSKFFPKIFEEKYEKGEMFREFVAVAIIAVGLAFLIK